jgi:hypothetical protein
MPQANLVKKQFKEFRRPRALSKTVAICDNDHASRNTKHFLYNRRWIWNVVQNTEFTDRVKAAVGEGESIPRRLQ